MKARAPFQKFSFRSFFYRPLLTHFVLLAFVTSTLGILPVYAQDFRLPTPGVMVHLSPPLDPPLLKGIKVYPDNPLHFNFILDRGEGQLSNDALKDESGKLIKYFLASLTIPEKDLWVNLSPYEKDRVIPRSFGLTEMGRDLLAEDYMLKQITASLIYPEDEIGKKFWKRIYEEAEKKFGTTNISVNTFNKVWIVPEKADVYENAKAGTAYVVESKLKVMLEQDYLSLEKHNKELSFPNAPVGNPDMDELDPRRTTVSVSQYDLKHSGVTDVSTIGSNIVREIVIPELTKEVNEDKNFYQLRQVYNALILAYWYKKKIKDSILGQVYAGKNKIAGVQYTSTVIPAKWGIQNRINSDMDPRFRGDDTKKDDVEFIYLRYLQAFKKGVYNYIKEEQDPMSQEVIPRKYFSGGTNLGDGAMATAMTISTHLPLLNQNNEGLDKVDVNLAMVGDDLEPFWIENNSELNITKNLGVDARRVTPKIKLGDRAQGTKKDFQEVFLNPGNFNWQDNEIGLTRLIGLKFPLTTQGSFRFNSNRKTYDFPFLGFKEAGWKGRIEKIVVKDNYFEFTIKFLNRKKKPIPPRTFQIGGLVDPNNTRHSLLTTSDRLGIELIKKLMVKPVGINWRDYIQVMRSPKGWRIGEITGEGNLTIGIAKGMYHWMFGAELVGCEAWITNGEAKDNGYELTIEFKRKGILIGERKFIIGEERTHLKMKKSDREAVEVWAIKQEISTLDRLKLIEPKRISLYLRALYPAISRPLNDKKLKAEIDRRLADLKEIDSRTDKENFAKARAYIGGSILRLLRAQSGLKQEQEGSGGHRYWNDIEKGVRLIDQKHFNNILKALTARFTTFQDLNKDYLLNVLERALNPPSYKVRLAVIRLRRDGIQLYSMEQAIQLAYRTGAEERFSFLEEILSIKDHKGKSLFSPKGAIFLANDYTLSNKQDFLKQIFWFKEFKFFSGYQIIDLVANRATMKEKQDMMNYLLSIDDLVKFTPHQIYFILRGHEKYTNKRKLIDYLLTFEDKFAMRLFDGLSIEKVVFYKAAFQEKKDLIRKFYNIFIKGNGTKWDAGDMLSWALFPDRAKDLFSSWMQSSSNINLEAFKYKRNLTNDVGLNQSLIKRMYNLYYGDDGQRLAFSEFVDRQVKEDRKLVKQFDQFDLNLFRRLLTSFDLNVRNEVRGKLFKILSKKFSKYFEHHETENSFDFIHYVDSYGWYRKTASFDNLIFSLRLSLKNSVRWQGMREYNRSSQERRNLLNKIERLKKEHKGITAEKIEEILKAKGFTPWEIKEALNRGAVSLDAPRNEQAGGGNLYNIPMAEKPDTTFEIDYRLISVEIRKSFRHRSEDEIQSLIVDMLVSEGYPRKYVIKAIETTEAAMIGHSSHQNNHRTNRSMHNNMRKGGIDLTAANMYLQTQNNGGEIKFHLNPAMLARLQNAPGLVPVIINIQPLKNLQEFLGGPSEVSTGKLAQKYKSVSFHV